MPRIHALSATLLLLVLLILVAGCGAGSEPAMVPEEHHTPPIFSDMTYEEATAAAASEGKLLILDATASWCRPCKEMDKTTWVDETVVSWVREHAIAIQLDVDDRRPLATELNVRSPLPTVAVFRDGEEVSRVVGKQTPEALLEWLDGVL
ncbi:MAG: thioredoxin family protein [Planctomycetota bacterium]|nr:thioredoxin family protein [Planctomycetota bacterium]